VELSCSRRLNPIDPQTDSSGVVGVDPPHLAAAMSRRVPLLEGL
jgi:hypothetical protein